MLRLYSARGTEGSPTGGARRLIASLCIYLWYNLLVMAQEMVSRGGLTTSPDGTVNPLPGFPEYPKELVGDEIVRYGLKTVAEILEPVDPSIFDDSEANFVRNQELLIIGRQPLAKQVDYWQQKAKEALVKHPEMKDKLPQLIGEILRLEKGSEKEFYRITDNNDEKIKAGVEDLVARLV